jgi:hypothetical protein
MLADCAVRQMSGQSPFCTMLRRVRTEGMWGRSQWIAATHALNLSAGDSKSSVFLGRSFSSLATLLSWVFYY